MPASRSCTSTSRMLIFSPRKVTDLHHREGLQMNLRKPLLQAAQHLAEPVETQFGVQPAHDVKLGDRFLPAPSRRFPDLLKRHRVGIRIALLLAERAQAALRDTDVCRIDVPVDVEIGGVAVHPFTHQVRHVAQCEHVA